MLLYKKLLLMTFGTTLIFRRMTTENWQLPSCEVPACLGTVITKKSEQALKC